MDFDYSLSRRAFLALGTGAVILPATTACSDDISVDIDTSLPVSAFGAESTAEEVTDGQDLEGRLALVTGATSGIGRETARVLALRGARVIATGRTLEKASRTAREMDGEVIPLALELSDFRSVVDCAAAVKAIGQPLDILVCNAGINTFRDLELVEGIEIMFRVNHLGHFVLVNQLLPVVQSAPAGRIVIVASRSAYRQAPAQGIDFDNLRGEGVYDSGEAYGRSKLANALFSLELSRRLAGGEVTSNAIHPGLVQTNIARTAPGFIRGAFDLLGGVIAKSPAQGAATQVYVATHPGLAGVSGAYFEDCNPVIVSGPGQHMTDDAMAARLWQVSEEMSAGFLQPWSV